MLHGYPTGTALQDLHPYSQEGKGYQDSRHRPGKDGAVRRHLPMLSARVCVCVCVCVCVLGDDQA